MPAEISPWHLGERQDDLLKRVDAPLRKSRRREASRPAIGGVLVLGFGSGSVWARQ